MSCQLNKWVDLTQTEDYLYSKHLIHISVQNVSKYRTENMDEKSLNGLVQNRNIGENRWTRQNPVTKSKSKKIQSTNSCSDLIAKVAQFEQFGCSKIMIVAMRYPNILLIHLYNFSNNLLLLLWTPIWSMGKLWGNFTDCLSRNQYIFTLIIHCVTWTM